MTMIPCDDQGIPYKLADMPIEIERLWDALELSNQQLFDMCDKKDAAYALLKQCMAHFSCVDADLNGQDLLDRIGELLKADE